MIEVNGITRNYDSFAAVSELSFRVEPGEVLGLVGPNGAGKTTTLRCIVGILPPTRGDVNIDGHSILQNPLAAKRAIGFMPDEPRLFEHLTESTVSKRRRAAFSKNWSYPITGSR